MDHVKPQSGGSSSSSSFTEHLFGPKDASSTSSGLFSSVFGPSSTGLGRDSSHSKNRGSPKKQEFEGQYTKSSAQNETAGPSYLSSSIYYGGQEVYAPNTHANRPPHTVKKDGGDDDANGSGASRGNWWQGSLYY
ncbi:hypothetical protein SSX86_018314 [Deinandra increscens subsp. villosa]|uniref:Uncharacterized protein n=1 Tax=Deinandra increscens subsp. villosa TaxID=3103831 RepID=A0AAP0CXM0_9ASTR